MNEKMSADPEQDMKDAFKVCDNMSLSVFHPRVLLCSLLQLLERLHCHIRLIYLLLSPYLCFISFLYLDLYVLGDYALIS